MSRICLQNVWKEYAGQVVLERLNLDIEGPEFCTIVGASGCGKSTFLRMLLGQESPTRGRILLDGAPLRPEPDPTRGVVFQRYSVFPHLRVLGNVLLGLELRSAPLLGRLHGKRRRAAIATAREMLAAVGLGEAEEKYPAQLSGGMQQRLALAQTLVARPRILLLDEPFGALDPGIRSDMQALLLSLWSRFEMTVFMITHDLREGFELGTRLLTFDRPRVDPQAPGAYGATITYDIPLSRTRSTALRRPAVHARPTVDAASAGPRGALEAVVAA